MGVTQLGPVTHLTPSDVMALWTSNGGDSSKALTAAAIVFSSENPSGNAGIVNDTPETGDYSVGLWQVNFYGDLLGTRSAQFGSPEAFAADPNAQAKAAIALSQNGTNWQAWGPDFGYASYGQSVSAPLSGSRVGNWLASHGGTSGGMPTSHVVALGAGIVILGGTLAWAISEGVFDGIRLPMLPRFGEARENPVSEERLTYGQRKDLPDRAFALPEKRDGGKGGLPLTDARGHLDPVHVKNAASRLAQMRKRGTVTPEQYARAKRKIIRAACATAVERTCHAEFRGSEERDLPPMYVQSLIFPLDRYNVPEAKRWAKHHGYRTDSVDVTDKYIHLTQVEPGTLRVIRTVEFGKGIKAHVGREAA